MEHFYSRCVSTFEFDLGKARAPCQRYLFMVVMDVSNQFAFLQEEVELFLYKVVLNTTILRVVTRFGSAA